MAKSCPTLCDPWTAARQASLSFTISQGLFKLMAIDSVMLSNHLFLILLPSICPSIRVCSGESALCIRLWSGISPAISVNKDETAFSNFQPPNMNEGSEKGKQYLWSSRCRPPLHGGGWGEGDVRDKKKKKNRIGFWPQIAEMHMKGMMSILPDSCIFPYIEEH